MLAETSIINGIFYTIMAIMLSLFYFNQISGVLENVIVNRTTKSSFEINGKNVLDLWYSYFLGFIAILYLFFAKKADAIELLKIFNTIDGNQIMDQHTSNILIFLFVLILLFAGRIITRRSGVFYGKLHFSIIIIPTTLLMFFQTLLLIVNSFSMQEISFSSFFAELILTIWNLIVALYGGIYNYLIYFSQFYVGGFIGCGILAILGELLLSSIPPSRRSMLAIAEKFPSDFKNLTGIYRNVPQELSQILKKGDIVGLKWATKYLLFAEDIEPIIKTQYSKAKIKTHNELDYRVLKTSSKLALNDCGNHIDKLNLCLGDILRPLSYRAELKEDLKKNYERRNRCINYLKDIGCIQLGEYYFDNLDFLVINYLNELGEEKRTLLFIVRDTGPTANRIGLHTEEPYIIDIFEDLFEKGWDLRTETT